ncbi:hypothetical protein Mgra_00009240, partial [Meloidogyne graminicola]
MDFFRILTFFILKLLWSPIAKNDATNKLTENDIILTQLFINILSIYNMKFNFDLSLHFSTIIIHLFGQIILFWFLLVFIKFWFL